jgi:streptomycin 6-kinase
MTTPSDVSSRDASRSWEPQAPAYRLGATQPSSFGRHNCAVSSFPLPRSLIRDESRRRWIAGLRDIVADVARRWSIAEVADPFQPGGQNAWTAPVRRGADFDLVLKVAWRHTEAEDEAAGLREWEGEGTVRIHESVEFDETVALLIERCVPGTALAGRPGTEQDVVIAGLLRRLWRVPQSQHRFRPLQLMCDEWADEFEAKMAAGRVHLDPGLAREGIAMFRALPATATRNVLLCTDLHSENVLAAEREPWLAIDPKPYVGDPTYDALQHMLNEQRLQADPRGLASRMADLLELDGDRLLLWLFARCVQESPDWPPLGEVASRIAPA